VRKAVRQKGKLKEEKLLKAYKAIGSIIWQQVFLQNNINFSDKIFLNNMIMLNIMITLKIMEVCI